MEEKHNTLEYYNKNAKIYFEQTLIGNLQQNYDRFLKHLQPNAYILDFGCGSGRDSKYFLNNGYKVKAIDGSIEMCKLASKYLHQEVNCMKFEELKDINIYDGIWACSSILHVEKENLLDILTKMINSLKINGIIYTSFKIGTGYDIKEGKYYHYLTKNEMLEILNKASKTVELIDYFETFPSTKRIAQNTIWCNFIIKKFE